MLWLAFVLPSSSFSHNCCNRASKERGKGYTDTFVVLFAFLVQKVNCQPVSQIENAKLFSAFWSRPPVQR